MLQSCHCRQRFRRLPCILIYIYEYINYRVNVAYKLRAIFDLSVLVPEAITYSCSCVFTKLFFLLQLFNVSMTNKII